MKYENKIKYIYIYLYDNYLYIVTSYIYISKEY